VADGCGDASYDDSAGAKGEADVRCAVAGACSPEGGSQEDVFQEDAFREDAFQEVERMEDAFLEDGLPEASNRWVA
jgi:hypothetical protein